MRINCLGTASHLLILPQARFDVEDSYGGVLMSPEAGKTCGCAEHVVNHNGHAPHESLQVHIQLDVLFCCGCVSGCGCG